uniref:Ubiquitin-like protein n=1 Tax=Meloidogyne incognita TaxID=6306 RepID=A0A914LFT6_MELIC
MVNYKYGRCSICVKSMTHETVRALTTCNHQYHKKCITNWISGGALHCPQCRTHATVDDIKQLHVEQGGNDSGDSDNELTQSTSNMTIQDPTPSVQDNKINVIIKDLNNHKICINDLETTTKVVELKRRIEQFNGVHMDQQRLTYRGIPLENDRTLKDYDIVESHKIIDALLRWEGGNM